MVCSSLHVIGYLFKCTAALDSNHLHSSEIVRIFRSHSVYSYLVLMLALGYLGEWEV